ncbi:MAG: OmpA family protein [Rikenellaceae bacterium]|nr:OmpA family protein [Rikenellaceae bacterium]
MKAKFKSFTIITLCILAFASCSKMNKTGKGALIGAGGGAGLGAGIGAIAGGGKGAAIGAAVGGAVGAGSGALIGRRMDKQQKELEQELADDATVETVTDDNDLQAIKITFNEGILFQTGKSDLSASSREALSKFARSLNEHPDTDVTIMGHTDNTGSRAINEKLSMERADAVENYLVGSGVSRSRMHTEGLAYDYPIADNSTAEGRAKNRRVEIYITAGKDMITAAEAGNLE